MLERMIDLTFSSSNIHGVVIFSQVYNIGGSAKSLKLLSLGQERKIYCYNEYLINLYVFHIEEYGDARNTYNSWVCIKESISNEFKVDYYSKLEKMIELQ
jgi:hypothetical protein